MTRAIWTLILGFALFGWMGCDTTLSSDDEEEGDARMQVLLTDDPGEIAEGYVTIRELELIPAGEGAAITLADEEDFGADGLEIDLLTLQDGVTETLADVDVPPGEYNQLRLIVGDEEGDTRIVLDDGTEPDLQVPSGEQIGLVESLWMIADGLGWALDDVTETLNPVRASAPVETPFLSVDAGQVAGIQHAAAGTVDGTAVITLDLKMYVGAEQSRDAIEVVGDPPIDLVVQNGIFGDTATVAMLVNMAPIVQNSGPGLHTMTDLPVPRAFATTPAAPVANQ